MPTDAIYLRCQGRGHPEANERGTSEPALKAQEAAASDAGNRRQLLRSVRTSHRS